jgi:ADP-ribose pyrophosphatase
MEKALSSVRLYEGKIIKLRRDEALAYNGAPCVREVVEHPGGTAIAPMTGDGRIICVRQFRYPLMEDVLEIPPESLSRENVIMTAPCGNWKRRPAIWRMNSSIWA